MQTRSLLALLLVILSFLLRDLGNITSPVLMALAALLMIPEFYTIFLLLYCGGWPLEDLTCFKTHCVNISNSENCVYLGLEILDCRHGCYDLSEKEFFNLSTTLFHSGFAAPSAEFLVIAWQRKFYIVLRSCGNKSEDTHAHLCNALQSLKETLTVLGCSWTLLDGGQLSSVMRPEILKPSRKSGLSRILLLAILIAPLVLRLYGFIPLSFAAALAIIKGFHVSGYTTKDPRRIFTVKSVSSFFTFPSMRDILSRSRTLYSLSPRDAYLAFLILPANADEEQAVDSEAYRSYEIGTALEKLSLIHKSSKFFAAARRRWERREALYRISGVVIADEHFRRLLTRLGLQLSNSPVGLEVLSR